MRDPQGFKGALGSQGFLGIQKRSIEALTPVQFPAASKKWATGHAVDPKGFQKGKAAFKVVLVVCLRLSRPQTKPFKGKVVL